MWNSRAGGSVRTEQAGDARTTSALRAEAGTDPAAGVPAAGTSRQQVAINTRQHRASLGQGTPLLSGHRIMCEATSPSHAVGQGWGWRPPGPQQGRGNGV